MIIRNILDPLRQTIRVRIFKCNGKNTSLIKNQEEEAICILNSADHTVKVSQVLKDITLEAEHKRLRQIALEE